MKTLTKQFRDGILGTLIIIFMVPAFVCAVFVFMYKESLQLIEEIITQK